MSDEPTEPAILGGADLAKKSEQAMKTPKAIRVLTVCAYLCVVSTAAVVLSIYYIFLWNPKIPTIPTQVRKH